jgi:hypothetical protein
MLLTSHEIGLLEMILNSNLGMCVRWRLEHLVKLARSSRNIYDQASHCREIMSTIAAHNQNYDKSNSKTWQVSCAIVHNSDYFNGVITFIP